MATVYVSIGPVGALSENAPVDVFIGNRTQSETITSSGVSARGAIVSTGRTVAQIVCATDVYATAGPSATATATATNGVYCQGGRAQYISLNTGEAVAVIDV